MRYDDGDVSETARARSLYCGLHIVEYRYERIDCVVHVKESGHTLQALREFFSLDV